MGKPEKIYLNNPNLMYNLGKEADMGSVRETFFFNQIQQVTNVFAAAHVDFEVSEGYLFELGGRNKKAHQIKNRAASFLVKDDIEIGTDLNIPLWLFGFLY